MERAKHYHEKELRIDIQLGRGWRGVEGGVCVCSSSAAVNSKMERQRKEVK